MSLKFIKKILSFKSLHLLHNFVSIAIKKVYHHSPILCDNLINVFLLIVALSYNSVPIHIKLSYKSTQLILELLKVNFNVLLYYICLSLICECVCVVFFLSYNLMPMDTFIFSLSSPHCYIYNILSLLSE